MFEHADFWQQTDSQTYCDLKDYMLFALPNLFATCDAKDVQPQSRTELILHTQILPEQF